MLKTTVQYQNVSNQDILWEKSCTKWGSANFSHWTYCTWLHGRASDSSNPLLRAATVTKFSPSSDFSTTARVQPWFLLQHIWVDPSPPGARQVLLCNLYLPCFILHSVSFSCFDSDFSHLEINSFSLAKQQSNITYFWRGSLHSTAYLLRGWTDSQTLVPAVQPLCTPTQSSPCTGNNMLHFQLTLRNLPNTAVQQVQPTHASLIWHENRYGVCVLHASIITLHHRPVVWSQACVWFWKSCSWSWSPGWTEAAEESRWQRGQAEMGPSLRFLAAGSVHEETLVCPECSKPAKTIKEL